MFSRLFKKTNAVSPSTNVGMSSSDNSIQQLTEEQRQHLKKLDRINIAIGAAAVLATSSACGAASAVAVAATCGSSTQGLIAGGICFFSSGAVASAAAHSLRIEERIENREAAIMPKKLSMIP